MRLTRRQRNTLEAVDNCIGGFPLSCAADHARRRIRALQKRGLIRKHKRLAVLTKMGQTAITNGDRGGAT
jgi:hypothetical protein